MKKDEISILLIEDSVGDQALVKSYASEINRPIIHLECCPTLQQGIEKGQHQSFDLILIDLNLPDTQGIETVSLARDAFKDKPIIALTGITDHEMALKALEKGAQDYLFKSEISSSILFRSIQYTIQRYNTNKESENLKRINKELKKIDRLKTEFVSTVSHELRTPLTIIIQTVENFSAGAFGEVSEDQQKWLKRIDENATRLHSLLNEILDLSKLQSGKIDLKREKLDLSVLTNNLITNLRTIASKKDISLKGIMEKELPLIWANKGRIEQVVTNLVTNAIKFTPQKGEIIVSIDRRDNFLEVKVSDTGLGIPKEDLDTIFDKFTQVIGGIEGAQSAKGIGLGLAICREIVIQHQGRIWVESEIGKGSHFIFRLPVDPRELSRKEKTVLIIDDDEEIREMLQFSLGQQGYKTEFCRSGTEGIEFINNQSNKIDFVLLDLMLPGTDGVSVFKTIRETRENLPVFIITAYPNSDRLLKSMEFGPITILAKPFNIEHIIELLENTPLSINVKQKEVSN